mmetsp:Transcript_133078/g.413779  ORF Transcript_133078/g.413779 Transcript_133078/m.413779 type:complete len:262 (-) Transcript_133078:50-835(-)
MGRRCLARGRLVARNQLGALDVAPDHHVLVSLNLGPLHVPVQGEVNAVPLEAALAEVEVVALEALEALPEEWCLVAAVASNAHVNLEAPRGRHIGLGLRGRLRRLLIILQECLNEQTVRGLRGRRRWDWYRRGLVRCRHSLRRWRDLHGVLGFPLHGDLDRVHAVLVHFRKGQRVLHGAVGQGAVVAVVVHVGHPQEAPALQQSSGISVNGFHGLLRELLHLAVHHEDLRRPPLEMKLDLDHLAHHALTGCRGRLHVWTVG